jgi:hypothetical protein
LNETRKPWIHAVLFLLLADAYCQFAGLEDTMRVATSIAQWAHSASVAALQPLRIAL